MCDNDRNSNSNDDYFSHNNNHDGFWGKGMECGWGFNTGQCIDGKCICANGFYHDLTYARYRNCSLPGPLFPIVLATQFIVLLFLIPHVFVRYRESKSIAKNALLSLFLCSISYAIFWVIYLFSGFVFNTFAFFTLHFVSTFLTIGDGIAVYSLISPLSIVLKISSVPLRRAIIIYVSFFRVAELIPVVIASAYYDDPNDETKDFMWSRMVAIYSVIAASETLIFTLLFVLLGSKLVRLFDESKDLDKAQPRSLSTRIYLKKVKELMKMFKIVVPPMTLILCIVPLLRFITGTIPFTFLFVAVSFCNIPMLIYIITKYASKTTKKSLQMYENKVTKTTNEATEKHYEEKESSNNSKQIEENVVVQIFVKEIMKPYVPNV